MAESGVDYMAITKLSERLRKAHDNAPKIVDLWLHKMVGPALVEEMKRRAPVDTGHLRDSIRMITLPGKVSVGPIGVEYNKFVVEGTKPHVIRAKPGGVLAFKIKGTMIYAKKVNHPGTRPNPYMKESSQAVMRRMLPKLTKLTIDVVKTGRADGV